MYTCENPSPQSELSLAKFPPASLKAFLPMVSPSQLPFPHPQGTTSVTKDYFGFPGVLWSEIMHYIFFFNLASFTQLIIHVVCISSSFFLFTSILFVAIPQTVKSPIDTHLGCLQFWITTNRATMNICVQVLVRIYFNFS